MINCSKEQLEYELVVKHLEFRDGVLWKKGYVDASGHVRKAKLVTSTEVIWNGYKRIQIGKRVLLHRAIFILHHNRPIKEGFQVHHINQNRIDNRIENLIEVTNRVNSQNKKTHSNGKLVGCTYDKVNSKWRAQVNVKGKSLCLGRYPTEQEAHDAYTNFLEESGV